MNDDRSDSIFDFQNAGEDSNKQELFAEVIIPLALPKNYTWSVPLRFRDQARPGCRVEVGLKNKKYAGIIKRLLTERPGAFDPKDILNVLDTEPVVHSEQLDLWQWIASYYSCSEGEVMAAALPAHFKLSSETILVYNEEVGDDFSTLDNDEFVVAEALLLKKQLKLSEVQQILDSSHVYPVIKRLIDKRVCFVWESLKESYTPKFETHIQLNPVYNNDDELSRLLNEDKKLQRAEKQLELLLAYLHFAKSGGSVIKSELLKKSGASEAQLKGLIDKKILLAEKRNVDRIQYLAKDIKIDFELTAAQQKAYEAINLSFLEKSVCLLHGITSSGKTLVYIRLIEKFVKEGKQVLYLLPEITLTAQIIRRLEKHFGGYIGIYHSKFNQNEKLEIWNKVRTGELKIILGARSSLFLPFADVGLVVVDEEQDASYKQQEPAPRYHARDAAIYYASQFHAKVLLGSATPSVESYFNASGEKYGFVTINERFGNVPLPAIEIVDTKKLVEKEKNKVILTPRLRELIDQSLRQKKQVILFQNRRGYSPYQVCKVCGWIPECKNCDVSLTYHKLTNKLVCHYCGTIYPPLTICAACGNHDFIQRNFGTERIEEELEEAFRGYVVARMDVDSVRGKNAHDTLIKQFEQQRIHILVGTQMVVKGLDFDNVNLVGILDADALLSFADFRVNERAFQMMEQVSGRAGRKYGDGKVIIQVANTRHPVLAFVEAHDYGAFYQYEIGGRQQFFYPPFSRVIQIFFRHKMKEIVARAASLFANRIGRELNQWISGPAEPVVNRVRNQYLMEILLKLPRDSKLLSRAKQLIQDVTAEIHNDKSFRSVVIIPDIDAV